MKIAVEKLNNEFLELKEDIPATLWSMDSADVKFLDNIHIDCKFIAIHKEVIADADITIHRKIVCSRCLNQVDQTARQEFKRSYNKDDLGEYLSLDKDIREEILLNFPMKALCKPDCKGLCLGCGVNINFEECRCSQNKKIRV